MLLLSVLVSVAGAVAGLDCGKSGGFLTEHRVVGGREATPGEFPWQVSLQHLTAKGTSYNHFCGGSLVTSNLVVTAAHCVHNVDPARIRVVSGIHKLVGDGKAQVSSVSKITPHDQYDPSNFHNDLALLKLDKPVNLLAEGVGTVCLPPSRVNVRGWAHSSGWGVLTEGSNKISPVLRTVTLPLIHNKICKIILGEDLQGICAGGGGQDTCQGDSGGPLTVRRGPRSFLVGVVSWGNGCGRMFVPGVYTQVSSYIDWIRTHAA